MCSLLTEPHVTCRWDACWVPVRNAAGKAVPGKKTDLVCTADAVRGVEVFAVTLPTS